jgi:hypothetical protein
MPAVDRSPRGEHLLCGAGRVVSHAIIVSTAVGMEPWLDQCLKSLQPVRGIPVIIYRNTLGTGEGESLRQAALYTQYDEVIFLHDTMELLDPGLIDYCFTEHAGRSIGFMGGLDFGMNAGKFKPAVLRQMRDTVLRVPRDKREATDMEFRFGQELLAHDPDAFVMPDPLLDRQVFKRRHGRVNMVLENRYLRKWKGCWNYPLVDDWDRRNNASGGRRSSFLKQMWVFAQYDWFPRTRRLVRKAFGGVRRITR